MSDTVAVIKFNTPFETAVKAAENRHVVLPSEYYGELEKTMRSRAFTVSYISKLEQISQIMASLEKAMTTGVSLENWKKDLGGIEQFGISKAHAETVFRNAIQTHYAVGHWESFQRTKKSLPYLRYSAINDSRTSECCKALSGIIRRVDDPFWATHTPPNHHRCILPWTKVTGDFEIGLKSFYSGEVVEIITKSGMRLAVTANHPVMSNNGWVSANTIKKGDRLLRHIGVSDVMFSGIVDNQNPPARADDVFDSLASDTFGVVDISAFKFHDDAHLRKSKVYVAGFDSVLMYGFKPKTLEGVKQWHFKLTNHFATTRELHAFCSSCIFKLNVANSIFGCNPFDIANRAVIFIRNLDCAFTSLIRRNYNSFKFIIFSVCNLPSRTQLTLHKFWRLFNCLPFQGFRFTSCSTDNVLVTQASSNNIPTNTNSLFNRLNAFARNIGLRDFNFINLCTRLSSFSFEKCLIFFAGTPFNSTVTKQPSEQTLTDSVIFKDFCERFSSQISVDDVVSVRNFSFSGHVYDFQCKNEVIVAGGIITHNCRSTLQALTGGQAQRRSPTDQGLNQLETDKMNPQTGWDYNPALSHDKMLKDLVEAKIANIPTPSNWFKNTLREQMAKKLAVVESSTFEKQMIDKTTMTNWKELNLPSAKELLKTLELPESPALINRANNHQEALELLRN